MSNDYLVFEMSVNPQSRTAPSLSSMKDDNARKTKKDATLPKSATDSTISGASTTYKVRKSVYKKVEYVQKQDKTSV